MPEVVLTSPLVADNLPFASRAGLAHGWSCAFWDSGTSCGMLLFETRPFAVHRLTLCAVPSHRRVRG